MPILADYEPELFPAWVPGTAGASTTVGANGRPVLVDDTIVWDLWGGASAPLYADNLLLSAVYNNDLARVTLTGAGLEPFTLVRFERSTDLIRWTTVRGAVSVAVTAGVASVDDYEFAAGIPNYYRMVTLAPFGQTSDPTTFTPVLDRIWLKSVTRPFLNRPVTVTGWSDITRPARGSDFEVVGRTLPVAVTDVSGSRRFALQIYAGSADAAQTMDYVMASGDVLFLHTPPDCQVPGGYLRVQESSQRRPHVRATSRVFDLPVVEVAAPGPDVAAATSTWQTVLDSYATWADLLAANATWADLLARIAPPSEVIVE